MTIRDVPWTVPLQVSLQNGLKRSFAGVYEALDFLENEWPLNRGERHDRAISVCTLALKRMRPAAVAREEFIAACFEAGMKIGQVAPHRRGISRLEGRSENI